MQRSSPGSEECEFQAGRRKKPRRIGPISQIIGSSNYHSSKTKNLKGENGNINIEQHLHVRKERALSLIYQGSSPESGSLTGLRRRGCPWGNFAYCVNKFSFLLQLVSGPKQETALIRKPFLSNYSAQGRSDGDGGKKGEPPKGPLQSKDRDNKCIWRSLAQSIILPKLNITRMSSFTNKMLEKGNNLKMNSSAT